MNNSFKNLIKISSILVLMFAFSGCLPANDYPVYSREESEKDNQAVQDSIQKLTEAGYVVETSDEDGKAPKIYKWSESFGFEKQNDPSTLKSRIEALKNTKSQIEAYLLRKAGGDHASSEKPLSTVGGVFASASPYRKKIVLRPVGRRYRWPPL